MKKILRLFGLIRIKDASNFIVTGPGLDNTIYRKNCDVPMFNIENESGMSFTFQDFSIEMISEEQEKLLKDTSQWK